jgi:hypothetical protein
MSFDSDFVNLLRKWGSYQPLAIWKVHYLYTTLPQPCHMARGHLDPQGRGKIYRGYYTSTT